MLPDFLWHGAEAYGFRGQVQTCGRLAQVMRIMWQFSYRAGWNIDHLSYSKRTSYMIEDIANSSIRHAALNSLSGSNSLASNAARICSAVMFGRR